MVAIEDVIRYGTPEGIVHLQVDISPVFEDPEALAETCEYMYQMFEREVFDRIIAVESAGTVFAASVAQRMRKPLVIVDSRDSLLRETISERIETHHGTTDLFMARDAVREGEKVIVIGDMLTHGKDVLAAVEMAKRQGAKIVKIGIFLEHSDFNARRKLLKGIPLESMVMTSDL